MRFTLYCFETVQATEKADKRQKQNANLRMWTKGNAPKVKSPGRPPTKNIGDYFRWWLAQGKNVDKVTARLMRLKPDVILHYAHGKPIETQVQLTGELAQSETEKAVARVLALGGIQSPSDKIKTP